MNLLGIGRGASFGALCTLLAASACTMNNPAFGETGEGEASTAADTHADGDTKPGDEGMDVDTGVDAGDGDGDTVGDGPGDSDGPGDGPGDGDSLSDGPGDGDGDESGDGDGDADCEQIEIAIVADTFLSNGPIGQGGIGCMVSWSVMGAEGVPCEHLDFGATPNMWIGTFEGDGAAEGVFLLRFDTDEMEGFAGDVSSVTSAAISLSLNALEGTPTGTIVWAEVVTSGDGGYWVEGEGDATEPPLDSSVTTYKYQHYASQTWPNYNPFLPGNIDVGSVDISGESGYFTVNLPLDAAMVMSWFEGGPTSTVGNGLLIGSSAMPLELLLSAREDEGALTPPTLRLDLCF